MMKIYAMMKNLVAQLFKTSGPLSFEESKKETASRVPTGQNTNELC